MWNAYIIKQERFKINDLNFHLKNVRKKKKHMKSKENRSERNNKVKGRDQWTRK